MAGAEGSSNFQLILDCACTQHAVPDCSLLCNVRNLPEPVTFQTADGSRLTSTVVGDIYTEDFRLRNVYVIPGLKMSLVSVFQLTQDDISAVFCKNHVELMKGGVQVGGAIVQGKMYLLRYLDAIGDPELHASPADPEPTGGSGLHASPPVPNESVAWFVATAASSYMKDMEGLFGFGAQASPAPRQLPQVSDLGPGLLAWPRQLPQVSDLGPGLLAWPKQAGQGPNQTTPECPAFQVGWEKNFKEAPLTY